jgi:DNA-binding HxlR family transcriptional regulator
LKRARDIPKVGSCDAAACVARDVLDDLSTKWAPLVLRQLHEGEKRYSELREAIEGISEKMLAQTLRELERNGLVIRTSYPVVPPHVVYSLSSLGEECATHVAQLLRWIETHVQHLAGAQRSYDARVRARAARDSAA